MTNYISVIVPTYNPNLNRLNQTLEGLKHQTLSTALWELILVDNNSTNQFAYSTDLSWHPNSAIVHEQTQGLTHARVKGFETARGEIVVLVDDDNVLDENYLSETVKIYESNPNLGAFGGKSIPKFEADQPVWLKEFYGSLALRDFGNATRIDCWENKFPKQAPIGAGMVIVKKALESYRSKVKEGKAVISDRSGTSLTSGGDNDIVLEILKSGWKVGYFPSLSLQHIIPLERTRHQYLARLINNSNRSWIMVLEDHKINPWKMIPSWSVPLRKFKAWFVYRAWKSRINYIRWRGACGTYDGLSRT